MITGKDAATGKKRSRLVGAAWTALNFVPVSKVAKLAKAAKVLATAKKAEKVAKNGGRIKRAARATKLAMKRAAEKLAKRKPARKTAKKAAEKARKAKKAKPAKKAKHQQSKPKKTSHGTKHKTTKKQQKRYNKKKAAGKARKASYARKKGGTKKKPGKRKKSRSQTRSNMPSTKVKGMAKNGKISKFTSNEKLRQHFLKHVASIRKITGKKLLTKNEYKKEAISVVKHGKYVPKLHAFIKKATKAKKKRDGYNYEFVGIDIKTARITTLHVKTTRVLRKKGVILE
ncbi:Serine transporter [Lactiplantibacillus plantarum]|nr:Serine transporter [Lactiplantibacillus plantarum]